MLPLPGRWVGVPAAVGSTRQQSYSNHWKLWSGRRVSNAAFESLSSKYICHCSTMCGNIRYDARTSPPWAAAASFPCHPLFGLFRRLNLFAFMLLRTLLRFLKDQPLCFHAIPHSLAKIPGVGYPHLPEIAGV